ncbi:hypothetical protein EDP1_4130 [Pseudomonas putida S610]|nr:hypothetical protein EDP1_4130 [Pseudomonas putida S610]
MPSDPLHVQQLGPQLGQGLFELAHRRFETHLEKRCALGCRQCAAVELAVGGQGQRWQGDKGYRHHVLGQVGLQLRAKAFRFERGHVGADRVISHQARVPRLIFASDDHRFVDTCQGRQAALDLTGFDTQAADLDLVIVAAQVLQRAVGQPAH